MQLSITVSHLYSYLKENTLRGQSLRFALFISVYIIARQLLILFETTSLSTTLLHPFYESLSYFITHVCCFILQLFYPDIHTSVDHTIYIVGKTPIQMLPGCTGLKPMIRLTLVLAIYPILWSKKLILWPVSILILIFGATLHFIILIPIANQYPNYYEFLHEWPSKIIFFGLYFLCWVLWEKVMFLFLERG